MVVGHLMNKHNENTEYKQPQYHYQCVNDHSVSRTHKDRAILQQ